LRRARELERAKLADPDSVRYLLEDIRGLIDRAERAATEPASCPIRPALSDLLRSPARVLADRSSWPTPHRVWAATPGASDQYRRWLDDRAHAKGGAWETARHRPPDAFQRIPHGAPPTREGQAEAPGPASGDGVAAEFADLDSWIARFLTGEPSGTDTAVDELVEEHPPAIREAQALAWLTRHTPWPFPVGKRCAVFGTEGQPNLPATPARDLMPFEDDAHAALIVPATVGETAITLYFLVEPMPARTMIAADWIDLPDGWGSRGEVHRTVNGDPDDPEVVALTEAANAWWGHVAGIPQGPGRPKGTTYRSFEDVLDLLAQRRLERGKTPPTLAHFCEEHGLSQDTFERNLRVWGVRWSQARAMIYGK